MLSGWWEGQSPPDQPRPSSGEATPARGFSPLVLWVGAVPCVTPHPDPPPQGGRGLKRGEASFPPPPRRGRAGVGVGRRLALSARLRLARQPARGERLQIVRPELVLLQAELIEIGPGEDAGVVEIVELDPDGVVAHRLQCQDAHMGAARDDLLLGGAVT